MRRLLIVLCLFLSFACSATAVQPSASALIPKNAVYGWYSTYTATQGVWLPIEVDSSGAMKSTAAFTIGSFSINPDAPYSTVSVLSASSTSTASTAAVLTSRTFVDFINTGTDTIYLNLGGTAVVGTGIPVTSMGHYFEKLGDGISISFVSATAAGFTLVQGR